MRKSVCASNCVPNRSLLLAGLMLLPQLWLSPARGRGQQSDPVSTVCVTPEMARLIVQEGEGIRVTAARDGGKDAAGVSDNARAIIASKAPETAKTMAEAHKWFQKAARQGYAPAEVNLAVLSLAGWGTRANAGEALYWLHSAAQQGYAAAIFDLGILFQEGCGVRRDYAEAFRFFERGALGGDPAAQTNLGYLYDQGLGVTQNRSEAAKWYRLAAEGGEPRAQYNLGDLYLRGEGIERDESASLAWFQKAALAGHAEARIMLGSMYAAGRGTPRDPAAAYMWLALAALQGDSRANGKRDEVKSQLTREELAEATVHAQSLAGNTKRQVWQSPFH
jgi:TPR repeat protein